jgi:outer membrane lipopolysaccharide assembly protein LptE/RlpB
MFRNRTSVVALFFALTLATSCSYGLRSSGGFPPNVKTLYIAPIDNKTVKTELDAQLFNQLNTRLVRALGVRPAGEKAADAVMHVQITRYDDQAVNYNAANAGAITVAQHQVSIDVSVQIIDTHRNVYILDKSSIQGRGEYRPDTQSDEVARTKAIESLIQSIIDGAQSQW